MRLPEPFVKICSLREPGQAEFAVAAGASAIGLIFAGASRQVTVERAVEIATELRRLDRSAPLLVVGVFVDQPMDDVNRITDRVGLDLVQLHGTESPADMAKLERPVIKIIRPSSGDGTMPMTSFAALPVPPVAYLVDGSSKDAAGGTGERADWSTAAEMARTARLVLAGGLTPENVGDAIRSVRPFGVDVSSGVETAGAKDRGKVIAFAAAARAAFAELDLRQGGVIPLAETAEPVHRP